jgi:hypothetical protein
MIEPTNAKSFWDDRYQKQETGWDLSQVSPPLKSMIDTLTDKDVHILIPGCGNAYEAEYLLNKGFKHVTLIDIAPSLVNKLKEKFSGKPISVINGDFFEHQGTYDLIVEQTFFCAINPALRKQYVLKCHSLLKDKGRISGLLFNKVFEKEGPPFGGTAEEYRTLFGSLFTFKRFEECTSSIPQRLGNEFFVEFEKKSN